MNAETLRAKFVSADAAVRAVRSGDRVYIGSNCGQPETLSDALVRRKDELRAVEIVHLITFGSAPYVEEQYAESFRHVAFFVGPNTREAVRKRRADYLPVFLHELPSMFRNGQIPIDVAVVAVSPPDEHGFCSLGVSVDIGMAACKYARTVIAEVNPQMPRTLGDSFLHVDEIDHLVAVDRPMIEHPPAPTDDTSREIARHIASLIEDGATIQTGIGRIPNAVMAAIAEKNDLGIHTEMFTDGLITAIERGNVNGRKKTFRPKKVVCTFCIGTERLYRYVDNNAFFEFVPTEFANDPFVIAQNERMVAINSAIEVDLTGQVVSDSIGEQFFSGIGGQVDFVRGAARSKGGKPIIALPSTAQNGLASRIVSRLLPHAGVVTSRGDVHYVVTEYGVAYLHGKSIRERALNLIRIAHPAFRDRLLAEAKELGYIAEEQPSVDHRYPEEFVRTIVAKNGEALTVRPILPTDEQLLKGHFYSLSDESKRHRFSSTLRSLSNATFRDLVNLDYNRQMAIVATHRDEEAGERIIGVARYYANEATGFAEVAMAVRDDWQRQGIGRELMRSMVEAAQAAKWRGLLAYVDEDNPKMIRLLQGLGVPFETRQSDGQVEFTLRFGSARQLASDR